MNIKSLLLGSAAAMVVVSGAQAADAVVVEAEPVEYVRVCDAYGSGFFFIPGTETCIRFSGLVRTTYEARSIDNNSAIARAEALGDAAARTTALAAASSSDEQWNTRARFNVDTRTETDWGTLRSLIRLQANSANDDGNDNSDLEIDQAFITVAGLRAGIGGSLFNANFAAVNLEGVYLGEDGSYGFSNGHVLDYTYAVDDLTFSVGIEARDGDVVEDATGLAKIQYSADFGSVGVVGEFASHTNDAYKAYATLDLSEVVPGGILGGFYMWQDDIAMDAVPAVEGGVASGRLGSADDVWGVGFQMNLTDNVEFIAYHNQVNNAAVALDDDTLTTIALNWYPVSGVKVFTAYSFGDQETGGAGFGLNNGSVTDADNSPVAGDDNEYGSFLIGLRRSF